MRITGKAFLFTVIAAFLFSCASGPSQKASRPVEDSLPPDTPAAEGQGQPADAALGLPSAPQTRTAPEVQSVQPADSSESQDFPLTTPQPPSDSGKPPKVAKPAAAAPSLSAAAPSQPAAAPSQPAAAPSQPAAQKSSGAQKQAAAPKPRAGAAQPQAGAAQPAVGPSQSAQAAEAAVQPAATQPAAAQPSAAPTYGKLREIFARQGDDVQIGLDGPGFLFLGFPDRSPNGDGMSFKGKDTRDGKTWFSFTALKLGTYDLDFLRQDNTTGTSSKETVRVHVVSDADFAAAVNQGQQQTPASTEAPGDPAFAAKLTSLGQYDAAIAELLKGYRDGNPDLNDRIAQLYLRTGAYDAAGKYFSKNMAEQGKYGESAVLGLTRIAIAQKDQPELLSLLKRLLAVKDPGLEETLLSAARLEKEKQEVGLGIDLASEYLSRYPEGTWRDEADYLLAQMLELDSPFRDIARARVTYREILDLYPESLFASRARDRIEYIDRHFFQIR